jgi:hypothetical protein
MILPPCDATPVGIGFFDSLTTVGEPIVTLFQLVPILRRDGFSQVQRAFMGAGQGGGPLSYRSKRPEMARARVRAGMRGKFAMKFGLYLKNNGVISADGLIAALEYQQSRMPPVGQLALEEGVLSARQVFKILHCQSGLPHERFGEVAVGMGMMRPAELQRLLMIQWQRKPALANVLVHLRILSQPQVDEELAAFRSEMERRSVVVKRCIPRGPHLEPASEAETHSLALTV